MKDKELAVAQYINWIVGVDEFDKLQVKVIPYIFNSNKTKIKVLTDGEIYTLMKKGDYNEAINEIRENYHITPKKQYNACYECSGLSLSMPKGLNHLDIITESKMKKVIHQLAKEAYKDIRKKEKSIIANKVAERTRDF